MQQTQEQFATSPNGKGTAANHRGKEPGTQFALFIPEANLSTMTVAHSPIKARVFCEQFKDKIHKETGKPCIRMAIPVCNDRIRSNDIYSPDRFMLMLEKLTYEFRQVTLVIDIITTGELAGWNILRNQCLKEWRESSVKTPTNPTQIGLNKKLDEARELGRQQAQAWEDLIRPRLGEIKTKGHIINFSHWPAYFKQFPANQLEIKLKELYSQGQNPFSYVVSSKINQINMRLTAQKIPVDAGIAQPYNLGYVLEEAAFETWILTQDLYDCQFDEAHDSDHCFTQVLIDYAPKLLEGLLGVDITKMKKASLLKFRMSSPNPTSQHTNNFTKQIGKNTQPQPQHHQIKMPAAVTQLDEYERSLRSKVTALQLVSFDDYEHYHMFIIKQDRFFLPQFYREFVQACQRNNPLGLMGPDDEITLDAGPMEESSPQTSTVEDEQFSLDSESTQPALE